MFHGSNMLSLMLSGSGHDGNGIYTVPSGSTGYLRSMYCNTGRDGTIRWRVAYRSAISGGLHVIRDIENYRSHQRFDVMGPKLTSGTDLIISVQRVDGAATMSVTAGALIYIVEDIAGTR